jgi:tetratricopeptide (TPR) repeat protein
MPRAPLSEREAMRLFAAHAADARGARVVGKNDREAVRAIVRLLGHNRVGIQLAAARAAELSPAVIATGLQQLHDNALSTKGARKKLARGEADRLLGQLPSAASQLEDVLREARGDLHAEAEAHRLLGAVYRTQGQLERALEHKRAAEERFVALGDPARRAIAHGEVGTALAALGRLREARACHEQALAMHRELGNRKQEGVELSYLGVALHRAGLLEEARRAHLAALSLHRETENRRLEGAELLHLGYVEHQRGQLDAARVHHHEALAILRAVSDRALEGVVLSHLGALEIEAGHPEEAGALLEQAMLCHRAVHSPRHEATTWLHRALHHAALHEDDAAAKCLDQALAVGAGRVEPEQHAFLLALLGRFDDATAIVHEDAATAHAIELLARAHAIAAGALPPTAARSKGDESTPTSARVRHARSVLAAAIAKGGTSLEIACDGRWFVGVDGVRVDLSRRGPLRRALSLLGQRRVEAPGTGVPWRAVLGAAWAGERMTAEAGFSRVRNALFQLRKLGLKDALLTRDDGYLLDPGIPLRIAEI